ncbi:MAG: TerB N-terminal domain-containing protein [Chloroflexia bacterium]
MDDLVDRLVARFRREMGLLDEEETGVDEFIKYGMAPQSNRKRPASVVRTADRLSPPVVADEYWVPPGQPAIVSGYKLKDGMVYIGHGLRRVRGAGAYEPSLIDPNLQVGNPEKAKSSTYGYYSYYSAKSYKDLSPAHRAAYLRWLAGGRKDPLSDMTYPFLFFYGLERRLLENWAHVRDEARALRAEAARLSQVYDDYYLNQHVSAFVELCDLLQSSGALYESPPPEVRKGWGMPLTLSIGLGQLVAERRPVPADWAEAWWRADPGTQVRAAADKRPEEFKKLWAVRYTKQFGTGLKPRRPKRSLQLIYRAASSTFGGPIAVKVGDLPDVTVLTSPMEKLRALGKECTEELGKYNLWVGKHPEAKDSLAAISLLPSDMFDEEFSKPLMKLRDWLDEKLAKHGPAAILDGGELIAHWRAGTDRLPRRESESLLDLLSWLGYGVVPDLTLGEPLLSTGPVALFQLEEPDAVSSSADYAALSVLMHVAAVVACASGDVSPEQRRYVRRMVDALPPVGTAVHPRLWAYFEWRVSTTGSKLTGLNTRIARLNDEYRSAIAPLAVGVAAADGFVSPEEVAALTKLYKMLDMPREDVFSHTPRERRGRRRPCDRPPSHAQPRRLPPTAAEYTNRGHARLPAGAGGHGRRAGRGRALEHDLHRAGGAAAGARTSPQRRPGRGTRRRARRGALLSLTLACRTADVDPRRGGGARGRARPPARRRPRHDQRGRAGGLRRDTRNRCIPRRGRRDTNEY